MWNNCKDREDCLEKYSKDVLAGLKSTELWQQQDNQAYNDHWFDHEQTIVNCVKRLYQSGVLRPDWYQVHRFIEVLMSAPSWNEERLLYVMTQVSLRGNEAWDTYVSHPHPRPSPEGVVKQIHSALLADFLDKYGNDDAMMNKKKKWSKFGEDLAKRWCDNKAMKRKRLNANTMHYEYVKVY